MLYRWFYTNVLKYEVGVQRWKEKVLSGQCLATEVATEIDEAHGLVLLINHWKEWERRAREGTARPESDVVLTVFTCREEGGQRVSWSKEGIEKFNELVDNVLKNRQDDEGKTFDALYQSDMKEQAEKQTRKRKRNLPRKTVQARNLLSRLEGGGSRDEEEEEQH
jgi:hypothetical protein